MSNEEIESAYTNTIEQILELSGNTAAAYIPILGGKSIELAISTMEEYLVMLKNLKEEYEKEPTHLSSVSPRANDSMLLRRIQLAHTSKSRPTLQRTSPEVARFIGSPMEIDNLGISRSDTIAEKSSFLDPTMMMDKTTHERGFLADVSDMNGTVRSRQASFHFNYTSPVPAEKTRRSSGIQHANSTIDFDADVSSFFDSTQIHRRSRQQAGREPSIALINDGLRTPITLNNTILLSDSETTPTNLQTLWNVKLRPGSNRKIDNEIRKEIQRQLACDPQL